MKKIPDRVMVISLDAVGSRDLEFMKTLPHFKAFFEKGALCEHVKSVYPSITYPAHTSIITGRKPANHGVINNTKLQPDRDGADWICQRKYIKSTTLYDEAMKMGKKVAALLWPVVGQSKIPYSVPEIMVTRKWQNQILVNALNGPLFYQLDLNRRFGHLRDGIRQPALDNFTHASALYTIRKYNPDLFLLHFTDADTNRHIYGVDHQKAQDAIRRHDERLGELLEALAETGDMEKTTVVLLGDHYQKDAEHIVYLNEVLRKEGLLEYLPQAQKERTGATGDHRRPGDSGIRKWKAVTKTCDGSCYVYLEGGESAPEALKEQVRSLFDTLAARPEYGIAKVFSQNEAAELGADPACFLMLEAAEGYVFLDGCGQEFKEVKDEKKHTMHGTHGYLPDADGYGTFFAACGCGISPGMIARTIELWDEGVTLAKLMGLDLGDADGQVIGEMLEQTNAVRIKL